MRRSPLLLATALMSAAAPASETITYSYDANGRLVATSTAGGPNAGVTTSYQYDRADNRTRYSVVPPTNTVTIADPSFEQPSVGSGFAYNPSVANAYFGNAAGIAGNGSAWGFAAAPDGSQVAFLQSTTPDASVVVQVVDGLVPGATYVVKFKMAQRPGFSPVQIHAAFSGIDLGFYTPASTAWQDVTTYAFQASGTNGNLSFAGDVTGGDLASGIDAVQVIRTG